MSSARVYNYIDEQVLDEIIDVLNNDGLIIFPTDTVYGIACNSFSDKAIKKLYEAKKRSFDKPIGVLTDSISKIKLVVDEINSYEKELIDKYFPGELTIVFNKKDSVSDILTSNKKTIGVRIPNSETALKILKACPYPLATTSVNLSGCKEGTNVEDFIDEFKNKVDIIIDSGKTSDIPSTIVRIENNKINIIRKGNLLINIGDDMKNIKTPEELLDFMSKNISYGYLGKNGKVYHYGDVNFDSDWEEQYVLQNKEQVLNNLCGNCWDQVEFERDWFINNGYEVKTFYEMVLLDYKNEYPSHSFLTYKDNNKWYWFENSDFDNRGIHEFNSMDELLNYQYQKYLNFLKTFNIKDEEIKEIIVTEFTKPKENISSNEYINHILKTIR